jgi:hypothetical protein
MKGHDGMTPCFMQGHDEDTKAQFAAHFVTVSKFGKILDNSNYAQQPSGLLSDCTGNKKDSILTRYQHSVGRERVGVQFLDVSKFVKKSLFSYFRCKHKLIQYNKMILFLFSCLLAETSEQMM